MRTTGQKQFDYVDPRNREVQIEMEAACTLLLKRLGALLQPPFKEIDFSETIFEKQRPQWSSPSATASKPLKRPYYRSFHNKQTTPSIS
jgi:hypothetical protein